MSTIRQARSRTGLWFNPKGLFGLEDGRKIASGEFYRLSFVPLTNQINLSMWRNSCESHRGQHCEDLFIRQPPAER